MKFAFLISNLSGGGAEFVAREWARELSSRGHDVTVFVTHPKDSDKEFFSGRIVQITGRTPIGRILRLRSELRDARFEHLIALLPYFNLLALLATFAMRDGPLVSISGRNVEGPVPDVHGSHFRLTRWISRRLFPHAHRFIAISHPVAAEAIVLFGLDADRVRVVPNPATSKITSDVRTLIPRHRSAKIGDIVVPGRIAAQKRPLVAVQTVAELRERGHDAKLHFCGVGSLQSSVEAASSRLGVPVTFHGWSERWFEGLSPDAIVLLPSAVEGFGNVLVEAACSGFPSVASSGSLGAADAIVPGISGSLVCGATAVDFADGIEEAASIGSVLPTPWLMRFTPGNSVDVLLRALK